MPVNIRTISLDFSPSTDCFPRKHITLVLGLALPGEMFCLPVLSQVLSHPRGRPGWE